MPVESFVLRPVTGLTGLGVVSNLFTACISKEVGGFACARIFLAVWIDAFISEFGGHSHGVW